MQKNLEFGANYYGKKSSNAWPVEIDGKYCSVIKEYLEKDGIPEDGISRIIQNAAMTLSYGPNPFSQDNCQKTGIVIGKVQSGKTSNFITLSALAFDNQYSVVVVFGGTKKPLLQQNRDRIREYYDSTKEILVLDTADYKEELTTNKVQQFIKMGKKVVVVALKHTTHIDYLKDNLFMNSALVDQPILIIDDEGDEASLNTLVKKGKKSATYQSIESLKKILNRHSFVSVTATPQANLLIDTLDVLSPDFGVLVDPGRGYCGLDVFHGTNDYTIEIPDAESSLLDAGVPVSYIRALSMFFVSCAIQRFRGMKPGEKFSMLVHPSQKKADHQVVFKKTSDLINTWIEITNQKDDIAYSSVKKYLEEAHSEYSQTTIKNIPSFSAIEDDIIEVINMCGLQLVNGDAQRPSDDIYDYNIYIGGTMLGRGLTIKGLVITYIIRTSKGASATDTVQQRARWFGYKTKYLDLCRVFAVKKILKEFHEIRNHEEDLWDTIRRSNMQGEQFKNMARIFVLSDDLRLTRPGVGKSEGFTFSSWNKQRVFQKDAEYIDNNMNVICGFKKQHQDEIITSKFGEGAPYSIIKSDFQTVYDSLLSKLLIPTTPKFSASLITKLYSLLLRKGLNPLIDVIWMRDGTTSKHEIRFDDTIPNYTVGRRPQDITKPTIYKGDDYQFVDPDTMQLQIHMIEDTNTGIVSPTITIYVPTNVAGYLTNLVIKS